MIFDGILPNIYSNGTVIRMIRLDFKSSLKKS